MKTFLRATALMLSLVFVMTGFAVPFAALRASAVETGEGLGASAACEGHTLGTFSGLPACVNKNGDLHICKNNFPSKNFRSFLIATAFGSTGYFDEKHYLTTLNVESRGITSLRGIEFFTRLTSLSCGYNQLTELDVSNNTALTYFSCYSNQLTELDVSNNTALTSLGCGSNQLTELDVSNNTALTTLGCHANQLTELDVSNNTALTYLSCNYNQLTELDVSNNTALTTLGCYSNQLTELDLSNNTALTYLSCNYNQLTELDVSNNTALISLSCSSNQLTELDVSNNTELQKLICTSNHLSELDVSKNKKLEYLTCNSNQRDLELISKNGLWTADMSKLVSPSNFDRITSFSQGTFDSKTGLLTFAGKPSSFTYKYDVGYVKNDRTMTVTVNLTEHIHSFSGWQVRTPASCTEPGEEFRACACGEEETRSIDPLGHTLVKTEAVEPTETSAGNIEYWTCTVCGKLFSDEAANNEITQAETVLPKLEHTHVYGSYAYDGNAHWQTCACGQTSERTPHAFGAWTVTKEPTYTEEGSRSRTCVCGFTETETLPCAVLLGDVNLDGKVTPTDYLLLKRQLVVEDCLTEAGKQRADINGDGALTPTDYLLLKRMILGL